MGIEEKEDGLDHIWRGVGDCQKKLDMVALFRRDMNYAEDLFVTTRAPTVDPTS